MDEQPHQQAILFTTTAAKLFAHSVQIPRGHRLGLLCRRPFVVSRRSRERAVTQAVAARCGEPIIDTRRRFGLINRKCESCGVMSDSGLFEFCVSRAEAVDDLKERRRTTQRSARAPGQRCQTLAIECVRRNFAGNLNTQSIHSICHSCSRYSTLLGLRSEACRDHGKGTGKTEIGAP